MGAPGAGHAGRVGVDDQERPANRAGLGRAREMGGLAHSVPDVGGAAEVQSGGARPVPATGARRDHHPEIHRRDHREPPDPHLPDRGLPRHQLHRRRRHGGHPDHPADQPRSRRERLARCQSGADRQQRAPAVRRGVVLQRDAGQHHRVEERGQPVRGCPGCAQPAADLPAGIPHGIPVHRRHRRLRRHLRQVRDPVHSAVSLLAVERGRRGRRRRGR